MQSENVVVARDALKTGRRRMAAANEFCPPRLARTTCRDVEWLLAQSVGARENR